MAQKDHAHLHIRRKNYKKRKQNKTKQQQQQQQKHYSFFNWIENALNGHLDKFLTLISLNLSEEVLNALQKKKKFQSEGTFETPSNVWFVCFFILSSCMRKQGKIIRDK